MEVSLILSFDIIKSSLFCEHLKLLVLTASLRESFFTNAQN